MKRIIIGATASLLCLGSVNAQIPINQFPAKVKIEVNGCNVRCGPGTDCAKVGTCNKDQMVDCIGKCGDWYIVQLPDDTIGCISDVYAEPASF